MMYR
ncbi:unnamed protein product [Lactuca saligna]